MPNQPQEPLHAVLKRLEQGYASPEYTTAAHDNDSKPATNGHSLPAPHLSTFPLLVAVCLIPHNHPEDYAQLFLYFADVSHHADVAGLPILVKRLRVALFKAVPLVGVPRVINALGALYDAIQAHPRGEEILQSLPAESTKPTKTTEEDSAAGWAFFKAIYAQHAEKIIERIGTTSPDLAEMIVDELYGANLSRREVLSWKETVLIEFTGWCAPSLFSSTSADLNRTALRWTAQHKPKGISTDARISKWTREKCNEL